MPRATVDTLLGYQFGVQRTHQPQLGADGLVIHDSKGDPKTVEITLLVLADPHTGHQVHVPLPDEARVELARQLTGGLILAGNGAV